MLRAIGGIEETNEAQPLTDFLEVNVSSVLCRTLLCCSLLCLVTDILLCAVCFCRAPLLRLYIRTGECQACA